MTESIHIWLQKKKGTWTITWGLLQQFRQVVGLIHQNSNHVPSDYPSSKPIEQEVCTFITLHQIVLTFELLLNLAQLYTLYTEIS